MKYTYDFKLQCVQKYKNGEHVPMPEFSGGTKENFQKKVLEWVALYELHGPEALAKKQFDRVWTVEEKLNLICKVEAGKSIKQTAVEAAINNGLLYSWIKKYREAGLDGLNCKRGRRRQAPMGKPKKKQELTKSEAEELALLRARNKFLEAENAYLKKLDALVIKREIARPKAKKHKLSKISSKQKKDGN